MWIGIAVVLMVSGEFSTDAALFKSEAECVAENTKLVARIKDAPMAVSYRVECLEADKYLTAKK